MDLASANYCEPPPLFSSQGVNVQDCSFMFLEWFYLNGVSANVSWFCYWQEATLEGKNGNPFLDSFPDPLCKLNLKETSDFVKSLPTASNGGVFLRKEGVSSVTRRNVDAPSTPGRPIFSFSVGNFSRKNFPSKWDDAEKWLVNGSSIQDSPASHHYNNNGLKPPLESSKLLKQCNGFKLKEPENVSAEKSRVTEEKVSKVASDFQVPLPLHHHPISAGAADTVSAATDVFLKGKKKKTKKKLAFTLSLTNYSSRLTW